MIALGRNKTRRRSQDPVSAAYSLHRQSAAMNIAFSHIHQHFMVNKRESRDFLFHPYKRPVFIALMFDAAKPLEKADAVKQLEKLTLENNAILTFPI